MSVFHSLLVACAFLSIAADCTPFRRDGNSTTVLGWNHTSLSTSSVVAPSPLILTTSTRSTSLPLPSFSAVSTTVVIGHQPTGGDVASHASVHASITGASSALPDTTSIIASSSTSNASDATAILSLASTASPSLGLLNSSAVVSEASTPIASASTEQAPYPISNGASSFVLGTGIGTGVGPGAATGTGTKPGLISGTGYPKPTAQGLNNTSASRNGTGPCTVNVPYANVDWWYAATYGYAIGTLSRVAGNFTDPAQHLTFIPNTETFDITSALGDPAFTPSVTYDSEYDFTWTAFNEYTVRPAATVTAFVSRTAYVPLPSGNIILEADFPDYELNVYDLPSASLTVAQGDGTALVATSATPLLYFTAYEVEEYVGDALTRKTITLPGAYSFAFDAKGIEDSALATGTVPAEFLQQIPQSLCSAGNFRATVTVVFVVDIYYVYFPHANPFIVHVESTALGFEDPTTDDAATSTTNTKRTNRDYQPSTVGHSEIGSRSSARIQPAAQPTSTTPPRTRNFEGQTTTAAEPTQLTVGIIGSAPIIILSSTEVIVGSQTLQPGGPAVTISGVPISLAPSGTAIVVGSKTSSLPQVADPVGHSQPPPVLTIGSSTLTANAATEFFVGPGQTLTPGGTATVDGTVVSLGPSASFVIVGSSTQVLPAAVATITSKPNVVVGGSTVTANAGSSFIIAGQTLAPGQAITVDGTMISLAPSASFVVVNGATSTLAPAASPPEITIGGSTFTAESGSSFVINGQTLGPNQVVTVDGTAVSLGPSASFVVVGGSTSTVNNPATMKPEITIGGSTFTANAATSFIINGQTLGPGQVITVDGTAVSLGPSASFVVVGGSTSTINDPTTMRPEITIGGSIITANAATSFVLGGQTLVPGQVVTVDGTTISLGPSASFIVVDGSTSTIASLETGRPVITLGGSTFTENSAGAFIIGGQTLAPGQVLTVDGTTVSLGPSAAVVVINGVTSTIMNAIETVRPELILGGSTLEAGSGDDYVVDGQTLAPGQLITIDGTTISLGPSASFIVINGVTSTLIDSKALITAPPLTIGNGVFTALSGTGTTYMIGSYYLTPGGVITVADTTISLALGATALVINGQTTYLSATVSAPITNPPVLTIGTETFMAVPGTGTTFLIDGQTLTPGGTITVDGTTIVLAPGATELVYGSSGHSTTTALFPATATRSQSVTATTSASAGATSVDGSPRETGPAQGAGNSIKTFHSTAILLFAALFAFILA